MFCIEALHVQSPSFIHPSCIRTQTDKWANVNWQEKNEAEITIWIREGGREGAWLASRFLFQTYLKFSAAAAYAQLRDWRRTFV